MAYKKRVSIHAPTWGATVTKEVKVPYPVVSIHAPTWGATNGMWVHMCPLCGFNPRTHMGCDSVFFPTNMQPAVSIHAPTWGATIMEKGVCVPWNVSIHAPTWGATLTPFSAVSSRRFQSTHPHGVRHDDRHGRTGHLRFNPRTHMGCD